MSPDRIGDRSSFGIALAASQAEPIPQMRSHMTLTYSIAALALVTFMGMAMAEDKKAEKVKSELDGIYTIVSGQRASKEIPADHLTGSVVLFEGDKVLGTDKDKKEFFAATFKIDTSTTPHKIMMVSTTQNKGQKADGVIEIKGDTIRLAYALPGGETPTDFRTEENQHYFVMKKVKKPE